MRQPGKGGTRKELRVQEQWLAPGLNVTCLFDIIHIMRTQRQAVECLQISPGLPVKLRRLELLPSAAAHPGPQSP